MATRTDQFPPAKPLETIDHAGVWLWSFVKTELTPYPGRAWVVARMTIAATIVMLLVMTFRLPAGYLGAIFTLFSTVRIQRQRCAQACGQSSSSLSPSLTSS